MKTQTIALVALASSTQLVSATFGWLDAQKYSCPSNTDNVCVDSQKNGFDWTGLNLGSFGGFGGFDFSGFECASSFDGKSKRDQITGRTFQNKCIKGKATPEKSSAPSFGCGSSKDVEKFSVKEFQVSVEFDCDLEFHYDMPDGSVCKQKSSCKKSGTTVKNTQCGGAKNVHVIFPSYSNGGKKSCDVGFHHIGFDCAPPASTKPVSTPAYTPPVETTPAYTPPAETTSAYTPPAETTPAYTPPAETTPAYTPPAETTPAYTPPAETTPAYTPPADTTSGETTPAYTPPAETTSGETTPAYTPPAETTSGETTPAYTPPASESTSIVPPPFPVNTTTSAGSVSETSSAPGTTELITSTILTTQVSTIISCADTVKDCPAASTVITTITTAVGITTTAEGVTSPPAETSTATLPQGPAPTAPCPAVLPQCLNTWLFSSGCKSNTDKDCFCSSSEFVDTIYECLSAHGASDEEVDAAQSYFQGICASYIPSNPAIVTGINTLTITASVGVTVPVTTVELITTVVVPCTQSEGPSAGSIIVGSSTTTIISTALTVPQVVFQTISGTSAAVSLVEGTAPAVATNPAAFPTQTTFSSVRSANETAAPTQPIGFTGAGSKTSVTFGTFFAAVLMAVLIM